ncbi:hypothetical protein CRUP_027265 [Coryphaenoides rupestris]|nr:hypothetical protein CRUP_027265 [Coryphaenoides rupestris]
MIAASAPAVWKTLRVCPADPLALAHPQANLSQSQGCRGEVSEESQHLIGDGFSDWMTEEVDFSSYLPNPPSPPNASLPPSPLHHDNQVPSDLEVMTSLLQEELAQLEDYFLSEPLPEKGPKFGKCDKGSPPPPGPPPCCHASPYAPGGERKQKKRDQNKTAAHRYRQRKRAELNTLEEQLQGLEGRNRELRDKAESVEREIQYVKDLLIEVYKARSQRVKQDATTATA